MTDEQKFGCRSEERIRELEAKVSFWRDESFASMQTRDAYGIRAEAAEAEVERLREALRRCRREVLLNWGSPSVSERIILHVGDVLPATPPSSTEGTDG